MDIEPFEWSVVIIGFWNPAILTPAGISQRLFQLDKNTPVHVEVPLDGVGPYRVKHDGLIVISQPNNLQIIAESAEYESLSKATSLAKRALEQLPETPVMAGGINIRYRISNPPDALIEIISCEIDNFVSDEGFKIKNRSLMRSLEWNEGTLNIEISYEEDGISTVLFNFDRKSNIISDLINWMNIPVESMKKDVDKIINDVLKITISSENNDE
ncbi:MAG TPA: hypothetical protein DCO75_03130 [Fibrobacteres bacterium]|jgi:hypothetical protein|nr:hypothetical protein [Fibrobacterota bacterium]